MTRRNGPIESPAFYEARALEVMRLLYVEGKTRRQTAEHFDLSVARIDQIDARMKRWGRVVSDPQSPVYAQP